jgi:hypothetical protein
LVVGVRAGQLAVIVDPIGIGRNRSDGDSLLLCLDQLSFEGEPFFGGRGRCREGP